MQNMIRMQDDIGVVHVYFDIEDGNVCNIKVSDNGKPVTFNEEEMVSYLAREYAASAIEMAMIYRSGMVPLKV